jgi:hypothetical protein
MLRLFLALLMLISCSQIPAATAQEKPADEKIDGFTDTPLIPGTNWTIHDPRRPQPPVVTPAKNFSQGAAAPSDAEVLFDGKDLSKWQDAQGKDAAWKVADGYTETAPRGGLIRTRGKWADFQLHVEWAAPTTARGSGQGRGNSGVLINNMYEVQVLDSYQAKTYPDGQAGSLYGQAPPLVNSSLPPGEWQTYDIIFESPLWNDAGEQTKKAVITVLHNGVLIHHRHEFTGGTDGISREVPWKTLPKYTRHEPQVFIALQDHSNPVRYRNIWIREINKPAAK